MANEARRKRGENDANGDEDVGVVLETTEVSLPGSADQRTRRGAVSWGDHVRDGTVLRGSGDMTERSPRPISRTDYFGPCSAPSRNGRTLMRDSPGVR